VKTRKEILSVIESWWTGVGSDGQPLELWLRLDRNHFRPDLDHLRAMLTTAGAASHSVQVEVVGTTVDDSELVITLRDECGSPSIVGDGQVTRSTRVSDATVIRWRPPAPSNADTRTVMDVRYHDRSHSRHMRERAETAAGILEARQRAKEGVTDGDR
jgi:hypothetical protein